MAISSIGVGSGLPLEKLLSDLRRAENKPLAIIEQRTANMERKLDAYESIGSAIQTLQLAAQTLTASSSFSTVTASASSDALSATTTSQAAAETYSIEVRQLATRQSFFSTGHADRYAPLATGDATITFIQADGQSTTISLAQADTSLSGIAKAINDHAPPTLTATLIHDGGTLPHRLLLTATQTGTAEEIQSISVAGVGPDGDVAPLQALLGFQKGGENSLSETPAQQALLSINGLAIQSGSNTISEAIQGVTLTLSATTPAGQPARLTIAEDDGQALSAIQAFVNAYNNLHEEMKTLTAYDTKIEQGGPLSGDFITRQLSNKMRETLNAMNAKDSAIKLSQMGISVQVDGTLRINRGKLINALKDRRADVQTALGAQAGLGHRMSAVMDIYSKPDGAINQATLNATTAIQALHGQYQMTSARIEARMDMYRSQFKQLDAMVGRMNSLSTYLAQQLSMLNYMGKKK